MSTKPQEVTIRLLGGFRLEAGGAEIPQTRWTRPTAGRVLKILALTEGHALTRARLAHLLRPHALPTAARASLRVALHEVRRVLEPALDAGDTSSYLLSDQDGTVRLDPGLVRVDLTEVTRPTLVPVTTTCLERRLDSMLSEILPHEAPDELLLRRRVQLRESRRSTVLALAAQYHLEGAPERALVLLRRVMQVDPLAGEVCRALMETLLELGLRSEAMESFHLYRRALGSAYGAAPDAGLRALHDRAMASPVAAPRPSGVMHTIGFVGRERELALLTALPKGAAPRIVLLSGEPGIGLTRLLDETAARLRPRGIHVLHARRGELDTGERFGELLAGLRAVDRERPKAPVRPTADGPFRDRGPVMPAAGLQAGQPVFVLVDDAHDLSETDRWMLRTLVRQGAGHLVRFVIVHRGPAPERGRERRACPAVHRLVLGRLSRAECDRLVASWHPRDGGQEGAASVYRLSGGNPLFALAVLRDELHREIVLSRIARGDATVMRLLDIFAASENGMSHAELLLASDRLRAREPDAAPARRTLLLALERAIGHGWIRKDAEGSYRLFVPAVREALTADRPRAAVSAGESDDGTGPKGAKPLVGSRLWLWNGFQPRP
ncbi:AAA family ATPase [Streptomyces wedmorensis]|uniref:AAA family ATPase n=1 Tax=Streptomyces wedmorensis TaxID=43759 RepID=A0ABW6IN08_STRWE